MNVPAFGAVPDGTGTRFRVWAPAWERVDVVVHAPDGDRVHPMRAEGNGVFSTFLGEVGPGVLYRYRLDGGDLLPDPASRFQPEGVHGPSEVVDLSALPPVDPAWRGVHPDDLVVYELHVGTFTPEGTLDAAAERLPHLAELGVTAVEPMPLAEFSGARNWGYDGVFPYAVESAYGGPAALARFVRAAHAAGLAVVLDVVYNHLGPEGNRLPAFTGGRFFTERHHTPWGAAVNVDGPGSEHVRAFLIDNAVQWVRDFGADGLRLDATHAILDDSPTHVLAELQARVREAAGGRRVVLIAEDERNERRVVLPVDEGGWGLDAVWADDFHHVVRRMAAGDDEGYYEHYAGTAEELARTVERGWLYEGQARPDGRRRGTSAEGLPPRAFVHCVQNHDQVGNRALGTRLSDDVEPAVFRAACALLLCSPHTPLLWMGQEWMASSPFLYFTDHPEELGRLVTEGRRKEFARFSAFADPETRERIPDPQAEETFRRSKLRWEERDEPGHAGVLALHRELLALRRTHPALRRRERGSFAAAAVGDGAVALRREGEDGSALLLVCALKGGVDVDLARREVTRAPEGTEWDFLLATEEGRFGGREGEVARLTPEGRLTLAGAGAVLLEARREG